VDPGSPSCMLHSTHTHGSCIYMLILYDIVYIYIYVYS
jgi:hypothetical protein